MTTTDVAAPLRTALLETFSTMGNSGLKGLNKGTSGNASVRLDAGSGGPGFLITPGGRPVDSLIPTDLVVHGRDLTHALSLAVQFETLCELYWRTLQVGTPALLCDSEMAEADDQFARYARLLPST